MTTTENTSPVLSALAFHGFASIDDAREANVFFVCHECQSIKVCAPAPGETREHQRDMLLADFAGMDECCGDDSDCSIL